MAHPALVTSLLGNLESSRQSLAYTKPLLLSEGQRQAKKYLQETNPIKAKEGEGHYQLTHSGPRPLEKKWGAWQQDRPWVLDKDASV